MAILKKEAPAERHPKNKQNIFPKASKNKQNLTRNNKYKEMTTQTLSPPTDSRQNHGLRDAPEPESGVTKRQHARPKPAGPFRAE